MSCPKQVTPRPLPLALHAGRLCGSNSLRWGALLVAVAMIASAKTASARRALSYPPEVKAPRGFMTENIVAVALQLDREQRFAVFSTRSIEKTRSKYVQVDIYALGTNGKYRVIRSVKDKVEQCEMGDLGVEFLLPTIAVTDSDADGVAELTFAYTLSCASDVSAQPMKLTVIEGADKHILRDKTRVRTSETQLEGGEFKAEGFKDADKLLAAATATWTTAIKKMETVGQ
jgi:hypothetical protein